MTDAGDRSLTDYERQALRELHAWKHPPVTWRTRSADRLERALEAGAAALSPKLLDELFDRGLPVLNRAARRTALDPSSDEERAYVLSVISASAAVGRDAKRVTRRALTIGQFAGKEITQRLLEHLPKELLVRVTAMSSSKAVPIAGAATGAAFSAWFLRSVAVHARFAYRQRFLERRHGPALLEEHGV